MNSRIKLHDVVALMRDLPQRGLSRGQVGTVVEQVDDATFEVEFKDDNERAYAMAPIAADALLVLRYEPAEAAK